MRTASALFLAFLSTASPAHSQSLEWSVGSVAGGHDAFGFVADVLVDERDRLWVLDNASSSASVFSPRGTLEFTIGRVGQGPGEFLDPLFIGSSDGEIWISDGGTGRVTHFDAEGELLGGQRMLWTPELERYGARVPRAILPGGEALYLFYPRHPAIQRNPDVGRLVVVRSEDGDHSVLARPGYSRSVMVWTRGDRRGISDFQPFSDDPLFAASSNGRYAALLHRRTDGTVADGAIIEHLDLATGAIELDTIPLPGIPMEPEIREAALDSIRSWSLPPRALRPVLAALYVPDRITPATGLYVGDDGGVWIALRQSRNPREDAAGEREWIRFSPGSDEPTIRFVTSGRIVWSDEDTLILLREDELGVQTLDRYRYQLTAAP